MSDFQLQSYEELVPEDLQVGREVMRISATDIDDGRNSIVTYELKANPPADMKYFRIDPNTGIIYLGHTIDVSNQFSRILLCASLCTQRQHRKLNFKEEENKGSYFYQIIYLMLELL